MIEAISRINFVAVLAARIWYGIFVAKVYPVALGREAVPGQKPAPLYIFGPVVCNFFVILTSAILIKMLNIATVEEALSFGFLVGIGYVLSTVANVSINPNFPRPFLYPLINTPTLLFQVS